MLRTGWDWDTLQRQPSAIVERMIILLNARAQAMAEPADG